MGRGGERVETPESLAYTAKRTAALKGKISWEEVSQSRADRGRSGLVGWLGALKLAWRASSGGALPLVPASVNVYIAYSIHLVRCEAVA